MKTIKLLGLVCCFIACDVYAYGGGTLSIDNMTDDKVDVIVEYDKMLGLNVCDSDKIQLEAQQIDILPREWSDLKRYCQIKHIIFKVAGIQVASVEADTLREVLQKGDVHISLSIDENNQLRPHVWAGEVKD